MQNSQTRFPTRIMPSPPPGWKSWEEAMALALEESHLAFEQGESPVGAVVLGADGRVLGRAGNRCITANDPTAHAEVLALRQAALTLRNYRLGGCVLVVTLEPCLMCLGAMVHARVSGLIWGATDPKAGAVQSCLHGLELPFLNHKIWQAGEVLAVECGDPLKLFFKERRT